MSEKIYVVHHVDNCLKNSEFLATYKLTHDLRHLMRLLASYDKGQGIFPAVETIAHDYGAAVNTIRRKLAKLTKLQILHTSERKGQTNSYTLALPCSPNHEKLSTTPTNIVGGVPPEVIHSPSQNVPVPLPKSQGTPPKAMGAELIKAINKRIRESIPSDFKPDENLYRMACERLGVQGAQDCIRKFILNARSSGKESYDWQADCEKWIMSEKLLGQKAGYPSGAGNEIKSTVQFFDDLPSEHPYTPPMTEEIEEPVDTTPMKRMSDENERAWIDARANLARKLSKPKYEQTPRDGSIANAGQQHITKQTTAEDSGRMGASPERTTGSRPQAPIVVQRCGSGEASYPRQISTYAVFTGDRGIPLVAGDTEQAGYGRH